MNELRTTIGLEIHVQLKTKSKMFCRCDNNAEGKEPNTVVCPVCLGLPGALPVANKQAIEWTIKTGIALNSQIPSIAKFDRKHYFYPDLPKGYQISQYDEPFARGGELKIKADSSRPLASNDNIVRAQRELPSDEVTVRFNRVHLEEDAGKLIHIDGKSLVDLNRAGTPLMEMVTEPDITSPKQAGDFLRRLQKLVRDEVQVSDADMEKGHLRCDANISVTDGEKMSEIVEIKNLNSFRFVEKALELEEARLKDEYPNWSERKTKVTRGYDSKNNKTYLQREKEEAADYRYFPEPDLPPFDTTKIDLSKLESEITVSLEEKIENLIAIGVAADCAEIIAKDKTKWGHFYAIAEKSHRNDAQFLGALAQSLVHNYFGFSLGEPTDSQIDSYVQLIDALSLGKISKAQFSSIAKLISSEQLDFQTALNQISGGQAADIESLKSTVEAVLSANPKEVERYRAGAKQLFGFFVGAVMRETGGKADPKTVNEILKEKLD